jgi:hypothetical protein
MAHCRLILPGGKSVPFNPGISYEGGIGSKIAATHDSLGIRLNYEATVAKDTAVVGLYTRRNDFITLNARVFPWINILWLGVLIMACGFVWSLIKRTRNIS